jgi:SynChlorMet cassette radical SAM/SPASM protein ScmE
MNRKISRSPDEVTIAITGRCNLSCQYCFYTDEMVALSDLDTEAWLSFFEELKDAGVMRVVLSGGEVFTRPDLWELIESIIKNKMRFSILTNGTLINDRAASRLLKYKHRLDYIQVSVDGSSEKTHDLIRGKGSFKRLMAGISALRKYKFPCMVRFTINKLNAYDLEATLKMLYHDLKLKRFGVNEAFPRGAGQCNHSTLEMSPDDRRSAFKVMQEFDKRHPGVASASQAGPLIMANLIDKINEARKTGKFVVPYTTGYLTGCNIMWKELSVLHDGTYVPCHQLSHMALGKVGQDNLLDLWKNSPKLKKLRQRHLISLESIPHCQGCKYQKYCTGGCPGVAYAIHGEVNGINPLDCYRAYIGEDPVYAY